MLAEEIMQRFLFDDAPDQINLSSAAMKSTVAKIKEGDTDPELFYQTLKVAIGNMEWDSTRKFLSSPDFLGMYSWGVLDTLLTF